MNIAIIPARGGSKRIPLKNIKLFCDKPIIAYSIEAALKSNLFDQVIVSTDNEEIANIAKSYGASVPFFRPNDLSDDFSGTREVSQHGLNWFRNQGMDINYLCCIYATAPFLIYQDLVQSLEQLINQNNKQYCFSVCEYRYPPQRGFSLDNNYPELLFPEHQFSRSQDLQHIYHDAGLFYWSKVSELPTLSPMINTNKSIGYKIPHYRVQDIDTLDDWVHAEAIFTALSARNIL